MMAAQKKPAIPKRSRRKMASLTDNLLLLLFALPVIILLFIFNYLPMGGLVLAFKDYTYDGGIFGSKWVGFDNFQYFFKSLDAWRITRNTLGYGLLFLAVGTICALTVALMLYEVKSRRSVKFYQTALTLPRFISWVIVSYITYIFLSPSQGLINNAIRALGGDGIQWFSNPKYWPVILTVVTIWKSVGLDSIMYYAALMGMDSEMFEAARIDGANRFQQMWHISLPSLRPTIIILCILALGSIFRGDFGLFYQIPRDVGVLYPATDIIDTYLYRGLKVGDIGPTAAVGLFQSFVGMVAVLTANGVVRKISPDNSLI